MVQIKDEVYLTASAAARFLRISRCMFYNNVRSRIKAYKLDSRRRLLYKQSELEPFQDVHPVTNVS